MIRFAPFILALSLAGCAASHVNEQATWTDASGHQVTWWQDVSHARILTDEQWAKLSVPGPMGTKTLTGLVSTVDPQASAIIGSTVTNAITAFLATQGIAVAPAIAAQAQTVGSAAAVAALKSNGVAINYNGLTLGYQSPTSQPATKPVAIPAIVPVLPAKAKS